MKNLFVLTTCLVLSFQGFSQNNDNRYAEIQPLITDLYDVISGPPGPRDWAKFKSLFHENGTMGATNIAEDGSRQFIYFTPDGYIERSGKFLEERGFFEQEIGNQVKIYGGVAQVYTAYQYRFTIDGPVEKTGINCIQLAMHNGRWYITNIIWEATSDGNPLPKWAKKLQKKMK